MSVNRLIAVVCYAAWVAVIYAGIQPLKLLQARPCGDHTWAQCDRASQALSYYQHGYSFLQPHTHNIAIQGKGVALGEFPLLPYLVSKVYRLTGFNETVYRLLTLLLTLPVFLVSFLWVQRLVSHRWAQLIVALAWLLSPNLIFYTVGFLPDTVALSAFFTATYLWFYPVSRNTIINSSLVVGLLTLAVLLKFSVAFLCVSVTVAHLLYGWRNNQSFGKQAQAAVLFALPVVAGLLWAMYVRHTQQVSHSAVFKMGLLLPTGVQAFGQHLFLFIRNLPKLYPLPLWGVFGAAFYVAFFTKGKLTIYHWLVLTGFASWAVFTLLMFRNASHHGYYHVPFHFLFFILLLCAAIRWQQAALPGQMVRWGAYAVGALLLAGGIGYANTARQVAFNTNLVNPAWYTAEAALQSAGVTARHKIFSANDGSYNISLYLMNRKGWNCMPDYWPTYTAAAWRDCNYAVLDDTLYVNRARAQGVLLQPVSTYRGLTIYQIRHHGKGN